MNVKTIKLRQRLVAQLPPYAIAFVFDSCAYSQAKAEKNKLKVCNLFADHMVLQQHPKSLFLGQAAIGRQINIYTGWGNNVVVRADKKGR